MAVAENTPPVLAWHFTNDTLRDGRPIPAIGELLKHKGEVIPCEQGLHASERIIDALTYAPGHRIHRVELSGTIKHDGGDKVTASERLILWSVDGEEVLRQFARECALRSWIDVHPAGVNTEDDALVVAWLCTGDEELRVAAWSAAASAAGSAAGPAAESAARSAVGSAAKYAAGYAAKSVAWTAAGSAAGSAEWSAAQSIEREWQEQLLVRITDEHYNNTQSE